MIIFGFTLHEAQVDVIWTLIIRHLDQADQSSHIRTRQKRLSNSSCCAWPSLSPGLTPIRVHLPANDIFSYETRPVLGALLLSASDSGLDTPTTDHADGCGDGLRIEGSFISDGESLVRKVLLRIDAMR